MLECGGWGASEDFEECASSSVTAEPGTLLRFDLPAITFMLGHHVGLLYKPIPPDKQLCASPLDAGTTTCAGDGDKRYAKTCTDTPEAFVQKFNRSLEEGGNGKLCKPVRQRYGLL